MSPVKKRPSPLNTSSAAANNLDLWNVNLGKLIPSSSTTPSVLMGPLSSNIYSPRSIFQFDLAFQKSASSSKFQQSHINPLISGPVNEGFGGSPIVADHRPGLVRDGEGLWKFSITLSPTVIESCNGGLTMPAVGPGGSSVAMEGKLVNHEADGHYHGQKNKPLNEPTSTTPLDDLAVMQSQNPVAMDIESSDVGLTDNHTTLLAYGLNTGSFQSHVAASAADMRLPRREITTPALNGLQCRNALNTNLNLEENSWQQADFANYYPPYNPVAVFSPINWGFSDANLAASSWHQSTLLLLSGTPSMSDRSVGGQMMMHGLGQRNDLIAVPGYDLDSQAAILEPIARQNQSRNFHDQQQQSRPSQLLPGSSTSQPPPSQSSAGVPSQLDGLLVTTPESSESIPNHDYFFEDNPTTTIAKLSAVDPSSQPQLISAASLPIEQPLQRSSSPKKKGRCICMQKKHACQPKSKISNEGSESHVKKEDDRLKPISKEPFKSSYDQMKARITTNPEFAMACMRNKKGVYTCSHCSKRFPSILSFAKHLDQNNVKRPYRCNDQDCPWYYVGFIKAPEWKRHVSCQHDLRNQYLCPSLNCSKTFARKDSLRRHMHLVHELRAVHKFK